MRELSFCLLATVLFAASPVAAAIINPMPFTSVTNVPLIPVTDVTQTDIPGTILYDELIPFSVGGYMPAGGGLPAFGADINGNLQSRVILSDTKKTLVFAYRLRDLVFREAGVQGNRGSSQNYIENNFISGFADFYPIEVLALSDTQSDGEEEFTEVTQADDTTLEFASFFTDPDGTTFLAIVTRATSFKTGKFYGLSVSSGNGQESFTFDRVAVPTIMSSPIPIPLPHTAPLLAGGLGLAVLVARKRRLGRPATDGLDL